VADQLEARALNSRKKYGFCALCNRKTHLTFHHLIPKKCHRRKRFQKLYTREKLSHGIEICRGCHTGLHRLFDELTLGKELYTLELLRAHPDVIRHSAWVSKQKTA